MSRLDELIAIAEERKYLTAEEWYELMLIKRGATAHAVIPDAAKVEAYRGRVPDLLIRLWYERGWGGWNHGWFWLCDPALLKPLIDEVFAGDPDYDPERMIVYAYDALGTVYIWLGDHRVLRLDWMSNGVVEQRYDPWNKYAQVTVSESETIINDIDGNIVDPDIAPSEKDMFPQAVKRLGELGPGEIYGFFPALSLGGDYTAKNLRRVPIVEHLTFLASIQTPVLRLYTLPADGEAGFGELVDVRPIGRQ